MSTFQCPHCHAHTAVSSSTEHNFAVRLQLDSKHGTVAIFVSGQKCGSVSCNELIVEVKLQEARPNGPTAIIPGSTPLFPLTQIYPQGRAKPWPDYVPESVRKDYKEACLIVSLSPKASATLSRRALQTMVRDRWNAKGANLYKEISSIESKIDPTVYATIQAVREVGNVGAHMEKDIGMLLDIDEGEAESLIELIEYLIHDWYVLRHQREQNMLAIKAKGDAFKTAKDDAKAGKPSE